VAGNVIAIGNYPDLIVTALGAPASGTAGNTIAVTSTVANAGVAVAAASMLGFDASPDPAFGSTVTPLGTRSVPTLAANASSTASTSLGLPAGLAPGVYYLRAVADVGGVVVEGNESNNALVATSTLTVLSPLPATPTGLTASAGSGQITLAWNASAGATGYAVLRSPTSGGPYTTIGAPAAPAWVDGGLADGSTWFYVVQATNGAGASGNSAEVSATTAPAIAVAPTGVAAMGGARVVTITWNVANGATSYDVLRGSAATGPFSTLGTTATTTWVDSGLEEGAT
jgi:hypothetical protein